MTRVHFYAGLHRHFCDYLAPIYNALPSEVRGDFHARFAAGTRAARWGIEPSKYRKFRQGEIVVVASYEDYRAVDPARVIFVNHGIGQQYKGGDGKAGEYGSYTGGAGRERTILFLGPSRRDALNSLAAYPSIKAVAVGVPYLDTIQRLPVQEPPVVAFSSHLDVRACPETRSAFPEFQASLRSLIRSQRFNLLGHAHPKAVLKMEKFWKTVRVPFEPDWLSVLEQASLYISDNSSSLYEAAALGIPVLCMNSTHYRKDVEHGLRFWDAVPGLEVDLPDELESSINLALADPPVLKERRAHAVQEAYDGLVDGSATARAAKAVLSVL